MRVISRKRLKTFWEVHPDSSEPLQAWHSLMERSDFASFAALKAAFGAVDRVRPFYVFDIGGNKYRIVATIYFDEPGTVLVRHVLTHADYDKDKWK